MDRDLRPEKRACLPRSESPSRSRARLSRSEPPSRSPPVAEATGSWLRRVRRDIRALSEAVFSGTDRERELVVHACGHLHWNLATQFVVFVEERLENARVRVDPWRGVSPVFRVVDGIDVLFEVGRIVVDLGVDVYAVRNELTDLMWLGVCGPCMSSLLPRVPHLIVRLHLPSGLFVGRLDLDFAATISALWASAMAVVATNPRFAMGDVHSLILPSFDARRSDRVMRDLPNGLVSYDENGGLRGGDVVLLELGIPRSRCPLLFGCSDFDLRMDFEYAMAVQVVLGL